MYNFRNDYSESAHPDVLAAVCATAGAHVTGYGADEYCARCADLIREQCACPRADVQFMVGGTQANFTAVAAFLRPWEAVICARSGHLNGHEGGAVEAAGHKLLLARTGPDGKLTPAHVLPIVEEGGNDHVTLPRLVYVSDATETGGVYTKAELTALSECCRANGLYLFLDGARLAAAFGSGENDLTLPDLARLCDVFYIGGTKCGALLGEAVVIANPDLQRDFRYSIKQNGGMLAKGRLLGLQFDALFTDGLYQEISAHAIAMAEKLREAGGEYGAKTGRPRRVGPIDIVATRYGIQCQGATDIALTKLDVLSYMDEIPICARYELNGQETDAFPFPAVLPDAKPVMTAMPGWKCDISGVRKWENLPEAARNYVEYVEREIGCHITYVSVGPERDSIIIR